MLKITFNNLGHLLTFHLSIKFTHEDQFLGRSLSAVCRETNNLQSWVFVPTTEFLHHVKYISKPTFYISLTHAVTSEIFMYLCLYVDYEKLFSQGSLSCRTLRLFH